MPTTSSPTRSVVIATFATVMLAAAVAQGFGRFTFGVVLPDVREDILGGSNSLGGFVATANTFAYLVGALMVGSLSAKVSAVNSVRIGLLFSVGGLAAAAAAVGALARVTGVHILPGGEHPVFAFNDLADLLLAAEYVFVLHQESVLEFLPLDD